MLATTLLASRSPSRDRLVLLVLLAGLGMGTLAARADDADGGYLADAAGSTRRPRARELVVTVVLNGDAAGDAIVLHDAQLGLLVERGDTAHWRIATPAEVLLRDGVEYVALDEVPGTRYALDTKNGVLIVTVDPKQFVSEDRALYDLKLLKTTAPEPGLFANYAYTAREAPSGNSSDGYLQLGLFADWYVLSNDWSVVDGQAERLNTTLSRDFPDRIATLRLGDFSTPNSSFGPGPQFGGLQWGTNFATRPGVVQIPLQRMQGQVSVPSLVEIFVNGVPTYRTQVQPGPFTITDIPVVTGTGNIEMVITDASGRRQVITNPFYASPTVLRRGLSEYSYQVGAQRVLDPSGLELEYGDAAATATHRWGVTDSVTAELHGEASATLAQLGIATALLAPGGGVIRLGLAASQEETAGQGGFGVFGYERVFGAFSAAVETLHATKEYAQIGGLLPDPLHSREQSRAAFGYFNAGFGSLSLSVAHQRNVSGPESTSSTATYTRSLGRFAQLSLSVTHEAPSENLGLFASLTMPFGAETTASLSESAQRNASGATSTDTIATVQRSPGAGPGWGYRASLGQGGREIAELTLQNEVGLLRVASQSVVGGYSNSVSVQGGMAAAWGRGVHFSRQLGDGFVLVSVPGIEGVGVYANNTLIGRTDGDGERLVPLVQPYYESRIALDATDIPLEAQLRIDQLQVVPRYRALAVLEFPADLTRGYVAALGWRTGQPVPAGATFTVDGGAEAQPVGTNGMVYLTLEPGEHVLTARWADKSCSAKVTIVPGTDPLPDLGLLACVEAAR
jgi:outer membrane usher protein